MKYADLKRELRRKRVAPCYLFVGEEDELKRDAAKEIAQILEAEIVVLDKEREEETSLLLRQDLLFGKRLIFVKEFSSFSKTTKSAITEFLKRPISVIIISEKRAHKALQALIAQSGKVVFFHQLNRYELISWIKESFKIEGKEIEEPAVGLIYESIGTDICLLKSEIEKIALFAKNKSRITEEDVLSVSSVRLYRNIFDLCDMVAERKIEAVKLCRELIASGVSEGLILYWLTHKMHLLFSVKERKLNLPEWQYRKLKREGELFCPDEAEKVFSLLIKADLGLKREDKRAHPLILLSLISQIVIKSLKNF
jgi:DNA polymerase-3 subunit delta